MKWVVFATAPDQITGEMWCELLRSSGINCRLRDFNPSFIGPSPHPVRLIVPEPEKDIARRELTFHVRIDGPGDGEDDEAEGGERESS